MALEIDMLSVGNADAIIIHSTDQSAERIIIIDSGNSCDGEKVVNHIRTYMPYHSRVDLLICTHPHDDHIAGVSTVIDNLDVDFVLIHEPESYRKQIESMRLHVSYKQLLEARKSLDTLTDVMQKISQYNIPHCQPFAGVRYDLLDGAVLEIVGPSEEFYANLATEMKSYKSVESSRGDAEYVDEVDDSSPFNNSSVIALLTYDGGKYLFTADAGPVAFENILETDSADLSYLRWMQIPHHGSRSNVDSELIQVFSPETAYVSAKGGNGTHPSPEVVGLFQGRKCAVYGTYKGGTLCHRRNAPMREGWVTAIPLDENAE